MRNVFGPAQDMPRVTVRESRLGYPPAFEIWVQHDREARLYFSSSREGSLRRIPLGAVRRGSGMERERALLDHAFARAVERVAEEHELVGIDVEVRVRSRDLPRAPARHDGHEGAQGEAAVRHIARLERLA